jgi:murein L,D-transpeptidase YafK
MTARNWRSRILALCLAASAAALLAGCEDQFDSGVSGRSLTPIPSKTLAQMEALDTTASSPMLIRTYKKEAELQVWKKKSDGQYALLKTFPMCRWSGQLGPKTREGDRQVPEGFYTITPGQMNPNSHYYLSFNVGYPNAYDRAWDRDGGSIMVHGICSSAGCYSMTDEQIAEIYALAREAFNGGQREIQLQSYPFKMTAENLAKHRLDPNIDFWKQLKNGSDHFEVTKTETPVVVCGKHYVFGAQAKGDVSARGPCPAMKKDEDVESAVAAKQAQDEVAVAALVAKGVRPIRLVYQDGGQNPVFAGRSDASDPEALVEPPREIVLDTSGKPLSAAVEVASAATAPRAVARAPGPVPVARLTTVAATTSTIAATPAVATAAAPGGGSSPLGFVADGGKSFVKTLFKTGGDTPPAVQVYEPSEPIPADVPLPPRRAASLDAPLRVAALPGAKAKSEAAGDAATQ